MIITAHSSHGSITFGSETGLTLESNLCGCDDCPQVERFNIEEYCTHYGKGVPQDVDILDLGYWGKDGEYVEPAHDWRKDVAKLRAGLPLEEYSAQIKVTSPQIKPEPDLHEVAMIAAIMGDSDGLDRLYEFVQHNRDAGYILTIDIIGGWAVEFYQKYKNTNWENLLEDPVKVGFSSNVCCWDDAVMEFAEQKFEEYKK